MDKEIKKQEMKKPTVLIGYNQTIEIQSPKKRPPIATERISNFKATTKKNIVRKTDWQIN